MTDDEKRELIAKARIKADWYGETDGGPLLADLADALEGTLTEPEWEYRWVRDEGRGFREVGHIKTESGGRRYVMQNGGALERRAAAGPWEVVTDDRD